MSPADDARGSEAGTTPGTYTLVLAKEDFKFSCAHFTLFGEGVAEKLHGHNYQLSLELGGTELDDHGLLVSFEKVKDAIRGACRRLDSRTLIPTRSPLLEVVQDEDGVVVRFDDRRYRFPSRDVLLLPLANTSIELLAKLLWDELAAVLRGSRIATLAVNVAETAGQSCWYRARL